MKREPFTSNPAPIDSYPLLLKVSRMAWAATLLLLVCLLATLPAAAEDGATAEDGAADLTEPDYGKAALGKGLFRSYCASCHGATAKGDGSLAEVLTVAPKNLTLLAKNNHDVFPYDRTFAVIDGREKVKGHGGAEMPAWGDAFSVISDDEAAVNAKIDQLVHFLWKLQVK